MIELTIPVPSPSLNRLHGRHWTRCYRTRKEWQQLIFVAAQEAKAGQPKYPKANVHIERYGAQVLDPDNFAGGCKPLIDALRIHQLIEDDDPDHLNLTLTQHVGKPYRTIIRITDTRI